MEPITETGTTTRRLVDRVAIGILIGVVAISVGGAALLTVYLNRIGDAAEHLNRVDGLAAYDGRPEPVVVDGSNAINYLLMTADEQGGLQAVVIAHLSATRRDLTLVALPSDLLADDGTGTVTLAASFAADPRRTARAVETLTGARMDHQVQLGLDGFSQVVDILGGVDLGKGKLNGRQVIATLEATSDPLSRSLMTAQMIKGAMSQANMAAAIADPNRFDKVMDALTPCLVVDDQLTGDEIRSTMVESRVRGDQVEAVALATTAPGNGGAEADPAELAELRTALATDAFIAPTSTANASGLGTAPTAIVTSATPTVSPEVPVSTPGPTETPTDASFSPKADVATATATR
ncbi:MAG: LCP family protein [Actinobacteria bacterium]|nr:LCP family protein [Actinomycetota bacterium]